MEREARFQVLLSERMEEEREGTTEPSLAAEKGEIQENRNSTGGKVEERMDKRDQ